jgi:DNA-binding MarR family transcriptional regulator
MGAGRPARSRWTAPKEATGSRRGLCANWRRNSHDSEEYSGLSDRSLARRMPGAGAAAHPDGGFVSAHIIDMVIDMAHHRGVSQVHRKSQRAGQPNGSTDHPGPHLFQEIVRTHQALIAVFSLEVGLSAARMGVLRQLSSSEEGSLGVVDLARALGVTPAIVTRQVQELEAEGLVRRRNASRDRRRSQLHLTARGKRAFARLHERAHELQTRVLDGLSDEEIATACHVLGSLRMAIETQPGKSRD